MHYHIDKPNCGYCGKHAFYYGDNKAYWEVYYAENIQEEKALRQEFLEDYGVKNLRFVDGLLNDKPTRFLVLHTACSSGIGRYGKFASKWVYGYPRRFIGNTSFEMGKRR